MFSVSGKPKWLLLRLPRCLTRIPQHTHPTLPCLMIDYASALPPACSHFWTAYCGLIVPCQGLTFEILAPR